MYVKRIAAAVAAISISAALAVALVPQSASAATNSISIAGVSKTNAPDTKSKGTIKTPTVRTSGNVSVSSRSYIITKSNRTVAKTSSQGKSYKLGLGTYKVKSTIKYRTYSETKTKTGATTTGWKPVTSVVTWSSWDEGPALPFPETSDLLFWGDCIPGKPDHDLPGATNYRGTVCEADGKTYRGDLYENDDAVGASTPMKRAPRCRCTRPPALTPATRPCNGCRASRSRTTAESPIASGSRSRSA